MASSPQSASGAASSSGPRPQQSYGALGYTPQGVVSPEADQEALSPFHEFQTHVDELCSKIISIEQRQGDARHQFTVLKERYDHQQQLLLNSQMHLEHLSNLHQGELSACENLQLKVQQSAQIVVSFQHHCKSIKTTIVQGTQAYEDGSKQETQCIENLNCLIEKGKRLQNHDFLERKELLSAIQDQRLKQNNSYAIYSENFSNESLCHQQTVAQLKLEVSQKQPEVHQKNSQLACSKETVQKLKADHKTFTQKINEDKFNLESIAKIQEEKFEKSKTALTQALEDKVSLTDKTRESSLEVKKLTDRILTLEDEQNKCIKRKELCIQNIIAIQCKTREVAKELEKVCLLNKELNVTINDLRVQEQEDSNAGKDEILKMENMVESYKAEASTCAAKFDHEISSARQAINMKQKRCEDLQGLLGVLRHKIKNVNIDLESLKSVSSFMETQLNEKKTEKQNLSSELEQLAAHISDEEKKGQHFDESLQQLQEEVGNELKTLHDKTEEIVLAVKMTQEAIQKKSSDVTVLAQSLEQAENDAKVTEISTAENNALAIKELQTRLENLVQQKELMTIKNQSLTSEQHNDLKFQNDVLTKKEMGIVEASRISEKIQNDSTNQKKNIKILKVEIEAKIRLEEELKKNLIRLEDELLHVSKNADGLKLTHQEKGTVLARRLEELSQLKLKISDLHESHSNALTKSCNEKKELQEKLATTKQKCETLSGDINHLKEEIDSLHKTFALLQKQKENFLKIENDLKKQTRGNNMVIEKKKLELEKLKKSFEKSQKNIRAWKRDAAQHKAEHQKLLKAIASAKAKV
ncbi:hypothetical protein ONE63_005266 [Megalurothrips usitatus]|uniref:Uncharacterized protein n=1 Tax=Megalurothrips usitatus TaxID=439358 RepID=A0AAV7Y271_9NEOP|nr:hypothetical protein ONE63_005266 [Megalurothrips usitatus]